MKEKIETTQAVFGGGFVGSREREGNGASPGGGAGPSLAGGASALPRARTPIPHPQQTQVSQVGAPSCVAGPAGHGEQADEPQSVGGVEIPQGGQADEPQSAVVAETPQGEQTNDVSTAVKSPE